MTLHSVTTSPSQSVSRVMSEKFLPNYQTARSLKQNANSTFNSVAGHDQHALVRDAPLHNALDRQAFVWCLTLPRPLRALSFFTGFAFWLTQSCPCCLPPCFGFPASVFYSIMLSVQPKHKLKAFVKDAFPSCRDCLSVRQFIASSKLPIISK